MKGKGGKREHWLDRADDVYDRKLIEDIKGTLRILMLFVPLPVFWALYDQQGSQWTIQATQMNGEIGNFVILPDQLQAVNPLLIIIFIPIFEMCIYPAFAKIHLINTPLKKLVVGGFLASLAFVAAGIVDLALEVLKGIYVFNAMNVRYLRQIFSKVSSSYNANHARLNSSMSSVNMRCLRLRISNEYVTYTHRHIF